MQQDCKNQQRVKHQRQEEKEIEKKTIQFVENKKSLKKGVDKRERRWYDNKAVARKSEGKELKRLMNSGIQSRNGLEWNRLAEKRNSEKTKKVLDKSKEVWYDKQVATRERKQTEGGKRTLKIKQRKDKQEPVITLRSMYFSKIITITHKR